MESDDLKLVYASLSDETVQQIMRLERTLCNETNRNIVLLAYESTN